MTNVTIPDRHRNRGDVLRDVMDGLIPVLLTAVIVALLLFRVDVSEKFHQTALSVQATACAAVKASNDDLDRFLQAQADTARNPQFQAFLDGLKADHADTFRKCVRTAGSPSTKG